MTDESTTPGTMLMWGEAQLTRASETTYSEFLDFCREQDARVVALMAAVESAREIAGKAMYEHVSVYATEWARWCEGVDKSFAEIGIVFEQRAREVG